MSPFTRARGVLGREPLASAAAIRLAPCRAIHTWGLRLALDVVFCDAGGVVLATRERVRPWRFAAHPSASEVWELAAGEIARLGLAPGDRLCIDGSFEPPKRPAGAGARGATSVEFQIALVGVLVPLVLAILQVSQLVLGRQTLDHATFIAARAAAVEHGSVRALRRALAAGLAPLVAPLASGEVDVAALAARARAQALAETANPLFTRVEILSPTPALAERVAEPDRFGRMLVPNDNLTARAAASPRDAEALRDANILAVRVVWCQPLVFPLVDRVLIAAMRRAAPDAEACYAANRIPIEARATVHMQSAGDPRAMGF